MIPIKDYSVVIFIIIIVLVFRGQNEDRQTREAGWNKYITITEQIYRIQVLYNS